MRNWVWLIMGLSLAVAACEEKPAPPQQASQEGTKKTSSLSALKKMAESDEAREVSPDYIDPAAANVDAFVGWPELSAELKKQQQDVTGRAHPMELFDHIKVVGLQNFEAEIAARIKANARNRPIPDLPKIIQVLDCVAAMKVLAVHGEMPSFEAQRQMTELMSGVRQHLNMIYRPGPQHYMIVDDELNADYGMRYILGEIALEKGEMSLDEFRERASRCDG